MGNVQELSQYIESHPADHEARWRLAKMLYMAWEYDAALTHLRVLKLEWDRRLNVRRYLAATCYRLGKYDEALSELEEITEHWPQEVPVLQQYARILEVVGRAEDSQAIWRRIQAIDPSHPIAKRALSQATTGRDSDSGTRHEMSLVDSSSGIDIRKGRICRNCGAQNGDEFDRCWQCHSALTGQAQAAPASPIAEPTTRSASPLWTFVLGMSLVAALTASVYVIVANWALLSAESQAVLASSSLSEVLARGQLPVRFALWGVASILVPIAFGIALHFLGVSPLPYARIAVIGLALGALVFSITWAPLEWLPTVMFVPVMVAVVLPFGISNMSMKAKCLAAALLVILLGTATASTYAAIVGQENMADMVRVIQYVRSNSGAGTNREPFASPAQSIPAAWSIQWQSTGQAAVDKLGEYSTIRLTGETQLSTLEMSLESGSREIARSAAPPYEITLAVTPETPYLLRVRDRRGLGIGLEVSGVLRAAVTEVREQPDEQPAL